VRAVNARAHHRGAGQLLLTVHSNRVHARSGGVSVRTYLFGLAVALALFAGAPALSAGAPAAAAHGRDRVPELDHVFVIVLENHNSFFSFNANGILDNPMAPKITALAKTYNFASNYHGVWHPSLPNYIAMIAGDWTGTDVIGNTDGGHVYPPGSAVGISDDDSPSVATDYGPPAIPSKHRWRVNMPSLAGQLVTVGKDWRAYLQNLPEAGTHIANWPGDNNTAKLYAVKHNPFPYIRRGPGRSHAVRQAGAAGAAVQRPRSRPRPRAFVHRPRPVPRHARARQPARALRRRRRHGRQ
jgi:phosphatidylinositol-3-phosphatase